MEEFVNISLVSLCAPAASAHHCTPGGPPEVKLHQSVLLKHTLYDSAGPAGGSRPHNWTSIQTECCMNTLRWSSGFRFCLLVTF